VSSVVESDHMGLPWLGLIYALLDLTNLARSRKSRRPADEPEREQAERERLRAERLLKLELRRYAEAIDALEQAGRLLAQLDDVVEPDDIEVLIGLGRARLQQGRAAEAAKKEKSGK